MGGSGKNEREDWEVEVWYTLDRDRLGPPWFAGTDRPAGSADERQVRIRSGDIPPTGVRRTL